MARVSQGLTGDQITRPVHSAASQVRRGRHQTGRDTHGEPPPSLRSPSLSEHCMKWPHQTGAAGAGSGGPCISAELAVINPELENPSQISIVSSAHHALMVALVFKQRGNLRGSLMRQQSCHDTCRSL